MQEIINPIVESSIEEEIYNLTDLGKKDSELIKVEMNTIEFPLFTKNKKVKINQIMKYTFNAEKSQYLEVKPVVNGKIPLEYDEMIFFALTRIYKKQNYSKTVHFNWPHLIKEAGLKYTGTNMTKAKEALNRMCETTYIFNNLFYSNEKKGILNEKITTTMFSKREIKLKEAQDNRDDLMAYFSHGKIKEIIEVTFSDHFHNNIIRKGYLYFDSRELNQLENAITRSIFMLLTKWRNKSMYITRHSKFLASRVPLSWKKENINKSVKAMIRAMDELKALDLIKGYKFTKDERYEDSYFEVFFDKRHNRNYVKRENTNQEQLQIENIEEAEVTHEAIVKKTISKEKYEKLIDAWCIENDFEMKDKTSRFVADKALKVRYIIEEVK